jgi:hypothetical protein
MGCHVLHTYNFNLSQGDEISLGSWTIDRISCYSSSSKLYPDTMQNQENTFKYWFKIAAGFNDKGIFNGVPFFSNDFIVDTAIIETDSNTINLRFSRSYCELYNTFGNDSNITPVRIESFLEKGYFKVIRNYYKKMEIDDTLYVYLPHFHEYSDSIYKNNNKVILLNTDNDLKPFLTSLNLKAGKTIEFYPIYIPPEIKTIKVRLKVKLYNHFTSEIIATKFIEKTLYRKDSTFYSPLD